MRPLLENPFLGVALGSLLGLVILGLSLLGFRHLTVSHGEFGLVWVGATTFGGMAIALAALSGYHAVARAGFPWFAGAMVVVFLAGALIIAVRAGSAGLSGGGGS